jgi:hypothetical protein
VSTFLLSSKKNCPLSNFNIYWDSSISSKKKSREKISFFLLKQMNFSLILKTWSSFSKRNSLWITRNNGTKYYNNHRSFLRNLKLKRSS